MFGCVFPESNSAVFVSVNDLKICRSGEDISSYSSSVIGLQNSNLSIIHNSKFTLEFQTMLSMVECTGLRTIPTSKNEKLIEYQSKYPVLGEVDGKWINILAW